MKPVDVLLCGLPGSGNNLLSRLVRTAAVQAGREVITHIWHGYSPAPPMSLEIRAIIPVRHPRWRRQSASSKGQRLVGHEKETAAVAAVMKALVAREVPTKVVSIEAVYRDPVFMGADLLEWMSLPVVPWPEEVFDANEKREHDRASFRPREG